MNRLYTKGFQEVFKSTVLWLLTAWGNEASMQRIPLSEEAKLRVNILFDGGDAAIATELLENSYWVQGDQRCFAALKLSDGNLDLLREAIRYASDDWRDFLMASGFGNDANAYKRWMPSKPKQ